MNSILQLLQQRSSTPHLQAPAPSAQQLEAMLSAAARAPDHAQLKPWRFILIEGQGLHKLGELYAAATAAQAEASCEQLDKARNMPLRAPMILVLVVCLQQHPKVPEQEQWITAGCAGHAVLLAAQAMGLGAFWRTGPLASSAQVKQGLGLAAHEQIAGFIYLGTPQHERRTSTRQPELRLSHWPSA